MDTTNDTQGSGMNENPSAKQFTPSHPDGAVAIRHCGRAPVFSSRATRLLALALPLLFGLLAMNPALAGRYELVKGMGVEVCEAYEKNLNSFKPRYPFRCVRPINPELKEFTKPVFRGPDSLPAEQVVPGKVVKQIERFLWERDANPVYYFPVTEWAQWKGTREQYARAWRNYNYDRESNYMSRWKITEVDIDNDGMPETVYRDGNCSSGALLLVLNQDRTGIDRAKTELVMPHPARTMQGFGEFRPLVGRESVLYHPNKKFERTPVEDSLHDAGYDVFQYRDRAYFDLWWSSHPDYKGELDFLAGGPLRVYMIESGQTGEICIYQYRHAN